MTVIRHGDARRTETPNAVMTTLASPSQGGAAQSMWRVDMRPGQAGPAHTFDVEQVWTVLDGSGTVDVDGQSVSVTPGDTLVLPAQAIRRVTADPVRGFTALVAAPAGARASAPGREPAVPPWIA